MMSSCLHVQTAMHSFSMQLHSQFLYHKFLYMTKPNVLLHILFLQIPATSGCKGIDLLNQSEHNIQKFPIRKSFLRPRTISHRNSMSAGAWLSKYPYSYMDRQKLAAILCRQCSYNGTASAQNRLRSNLGGSNFYKFPEGACPQNPLIFNVLVFNAYTCKHAHQTYLYIILSLKILAMGLYLSILAGGD